MMMMRDRRIKLNYPTYFCCIYREENQTKIDATCLFVVHRSTLIFSLRRIHLVAVVFVHVEEGHSD